LIHKPVEVFHIMWDDEAHGAILGVPGTGKSTLVRLALQEYDERVLVVDYIGNYEGFTDYYGVFPINPLDFINADDFMNTMIRTLWNIYGPGLLALSPAMESILVTALELNNNIPDAIAWIANTRFKQLDEENARKGVLRRMRVLYGNLLYSRETHPVLKAWLEGKLKGSIGIRLAGLGMDRIIAYVNMLLTILSRGRLPATGDIIVVDEAHLFMRGIGTGISTLEEAIRLGRNYRRLYIAITQHGADFPENVVSLFKVVVDFNSIRDPWRAVFRVRITNPNLLMKLPVKSDMLNKPPVHEGLVAINPKELKGKKGATTWSEVINACKSTFKVKRNIGGKRINIEDFDPTLPNYSVTYQSRGEGEVKEFYSGIDMSDVYPCVWNYLPSKLNLSL